MTEPRSKSLERLIEELSEETDTQRRMRHFRTLVELNKTRRRPSDPPAGLPVEPRRGGPFLSGGAAAPLVFENA